MILYCITVPQIVKKQNRLYVDLHASSLTLDRSEIRVPHFAKKKHPFYFLPLLPSLPSQLGPTVQRSPPPRRAAHRPTLPAVTSRAPCESRHPPPLDTSYTRPMRQSRERREGKEGARSFFFFPKWTGWRGRERIQWHGTYMG